MALMKVRQGNKWCTINCLTLDSLKFTGNNELELTTETDNNIAYLTFGKKKIAYKDDLDDLIGIIGKEATGSSSASGIFKKLENFEEKTIFYNNKTEINSTNKYSNYEINSSGNLPITIDTTNNKKIHAFINFTGKPNIKYKSITPQVSGDDITQATNGGIWEFDAYVYNQTAYVIWKKWTGAISS